MSASCPCIHICVKHHEAFFKRDLAQELRDGKYLSSRLLLDICDDIRDLDENGNTPVHLAIMSGKVSFVEFVCDIMRKKDPNIIHVHNKIGLHCAHLAACDDSTAMMKILLKYFSFNINVCDEYRGWTPLQFALNYCKFNSAMYLMQLQKSIIHTENRIENTIFIR